ncbi:anhydro-N-acetylmuramic acid kinase [Maricaulis salignorans]|uniref:Anhydro-N-acetylmuramic acid kinase n=1 Tax=Maricaulis salignorans TaxID=144026 RepID=A0A1G9UGL5_9PROT|nr:anhydro-N-acetylmuramic acid kinase [Maricaulis salignorans]SDM59048.1 anhydro-N-acetylmuramic acid kinase [Maricaulis salignorans]
MKYVIGLMSGTSLDGVDAALIRTDGERIAEFGVGETRDYGKAERAVLQAAVDTALAWNFQGEMPDFSAAAAVLTASHAELVEAVIAEAGLTAGQISLVGFHGQTVLHRAPAGRQQGRTCQIGDGQALADRLGVDVVYDFRSPDMAGGGQGAPLAPLYHAALVAQGQLELPLAVVNLGGVANVTWLAPDTDPIAFDTGPANGLIDAWCQQRLGTSHDSNGELAARGKIDPAALKALMKHPFFAKAPPKSLDRWDFSLDPVQHLGDADGAATLTAFTARTVAAAIDQLGQPGRILATGGGRHNPVLMRMMGEAMGVRPEAVERVGWRGDLLEAEAFAWLAARVAAGLPTSIPSTTGVSRPTCGGLIAHPRS